MFWDIAATFISVMGNMAEGNSAAKAAAFNGKIAKFNAGVTRQQGAIEENRVRRAGKQALGQMRANLGASGFDADVGTAYDMLADSTYNAELDALTTRYNYSQKAYGYDLEADAYASSGQDARKAALIKSASSILKGGTSIWENEYADTGSGKPFKLGGGSAPGSYSIMGDGETIRWNK